MKTNTLIIGAAILAAGGYYYYTNSRPYLISRAIAASGLDNTPQVQTLMNSKTDEQLKAIINSTPATVGASWDCQKNPNGPGCKGGNIHTVILPFPAKASWNCLKNPDAPGCQGGNIFKNGQPRVAGL